MNVNVKKASSNELKEANKLLTKLINDETKYDKNLKEDIIVNKYYEHKKDNSVLFFAYDNDVIIGYIYGFIVEDPCLKNPYVKLDALYVEDDYRGKKVGNKLINEFKTWCKENNIIYISVSVLSDNLVAKHLYMKHGFLPKKEELFIGYETVSHEEK